MKFADSNRLIRYILVCLIVMLNVMNPILVKATVEESRTEECDKENEIDLEAEDTEEQMSEESSNNDEAPIFKEVKQTIYLKSKTIIYDQPNAAGIKLGEAIKYKKYFRCGIGNAGFDQILFDDKIAYVKSTSVLLKKPIVPKYCVDVKDKVYSYNNMKTDLKLLGTYYPDYVKVKIIGRTYDNRNLYCAVLGNVHAKHQILLQGSMHAREYINSQLLMAQLEYYLKQYEVGRYGGIPYKKIFDEVCVHIIPMANPDGVTLCQYDLKGINDKKIANKLKKLQSSSDYSRWKSNARGVDINRNFPYRWAYNCKVMKAGSMNYPGSLAQSEVETKALIKYTEEISDLQAALSYHSVGNVIYWNYGQKGKLLGKCRKLLNIIEDETGYRPVTLNSNSISYGGYSDWVVWCLGVPAVTIETGIHGAPVSHSQFATIWKQNKEVIPSMILKLNSGAFK